MKVEDLLKRDKSFEKALKRMEENLVKEGKENTVFPLPGLRSSLQNEDRQAEP